MIDFISHYHLYIIGLLALICGFLIFYVIKFAKLILSTEEKITNILDAIDEEYMEISKILEKPVFFDSVEIRQVISSIDNVRNTFLNISNYLIEDFTENKVEEEIQEEN